MNHFIIIYLLIMNFLLSTYTKKIDTPVKKERYFTILVNSEFFLVATQLQFLFSKIGIRSIIQTNLVNIDPYTFYFIIGFTALSFNN